MSHSDASSCLQEVVMQLTSSITLFYFEKIERSETAPATAGSLQASRGQSQEAPRTVDSFGGRLISLAVRSLFGNQPQPSLCENRKWSAWGELHFSPSDTEGQRSPVEVTLNTVNRARNFNSASQSYLFIYLFFVCLFRPLGCSLSVVPRLTVNRQ